MTALKMRETTATVGAPAPFDILLASDGHLCLADDRDGERKVTLGQNRGDSFTGGHPEWLQLYAREIFAEAEKRKIPLFYAGDFIDFVSRANLDYARECFTGRDAFVCAGNHEYSLFVGEAWEDEAYKAQSFPMVKEAFPCNDIWYDERVIHGIRFVALDNNYYYILPEQLEKFKDACEKGQPVVLLIHNPLYSEDTYKAVMTGKNPADPPYLCGCPDRLLAGLNDYRRRQQTPDETTQEFLEFCRETPALKAVLAGHVHAPYETRLDNRIPQIISGGAYEGECVLVHFA